MTILFHFLHGSHFTLMTYWKTTTAGNQAISQSFSINKTISSILLGCFATCLKRSMCCINSWMFKWKPQQKWKTTYTTHPSHHSQYLQDDRYIVSRNWSCLANLSGTVTARNIIYFRFNVIVISHTKIGTHFQFRCAVQLDIIFQCHCLLCGQ